MGRAMSAASALTLAFATVALCGLAYNLWLFRLRQGEQLHGWLCVLAALGLPLGRGGRQLYGATSYADAHLIRIAMLTLAIPIAYSAVRFTSLFLDIELRMTERLVLGYSVAMAGGALVPGFAFTGETIPLEIPWLHTRYVDTQVAMPARVASLGFIVFLAQIITVWVRRRRQIPEDRRMIFAATSFFVTCALNDILLATGTIESLFLMSLGYSAWIVVFTGTLTRRFVRSMRETEQSAERLERIVAARTEELRQKDLQLAHGERMATLGTLAAGLAHEINNPIAFISANLNQLADAWKEPEQNDPVEDILDETREGVERIHAIVAQLLHMARRGEAVHRVVDVPRVVESVLPILEHEARDRARIETRLAPVPPVMGDERLLGQVVINLALNSLHAIPEGAPTLNNVTLSTRFEDGSIWLIVRDSGCGIAPEALPRIFDPFFTTKRSGEGTGLGLAVTHQLVSQHRGRIDVESDAGGTTVTVELPPVPED